MDVQHQTGRKVHCLSLQQLFCRRKGRWLKAGRSQEPCDRLAHPRVIFDNDDRLVLVGHYSVHALQAEFIAYMDSRKSHCNPGRSAPATARFSFVALTPLNYHSIATATRVETFNRSKRPPLLYFGAIPTGETEQLGAGVWRFMHRKGWAHTEVCTRVRKKQIIRKVQAGLRIHDLAQIYQSLVEGVDSN